MLAEPEAVFVIPGNVSAYLAAVATRLQDVLGDRLVGVYAGGSLALGGYVPATSDVDVAAVAASGLPERTKRRIVTVLRHEALPCPARGLELVVYEAATVQVPTVEAGFVMNLNTGRRLSFRLDLEPDVDDAHWFAIDRAILSEHGLTLHGPSASELFAPIPRRMILPVLSDSVRWHSLRLERPADAVLNLCRSLRYAEEGVWSSKREAGRWTLGRLGRCEVVAAALGDVSAEGELRSVDMRDFARLVLGRLDHALRLAGSGTPRPDG